MKKIKKAVLPAVILAGLCCQAMPVCAEVSATQAAKNVSSANLVGGNSTVGIVVGAATLDGKNYQQIGVRGDIPLGKLGIGVDFQFFLDEEGKIRKENWNEAKDYLDLINYIRWDRKGAPFYAKVGTLDFTYLGYSNIVNGYSNSIEYPENKRLGAEMSFKTDGLFGEFLLNDFKELDSSKPSVLFGTRLGYKILSKLEVAGTVVTDFNEYNGLKDADGDGYPDGIDKYPHNSAIVTDTEYLQSIGLSNSTVQEMINNGSLPYSNTLRGSLTDYSRQRSTAIVYGVDAGIPLIEGEILKMDLYSSFSQIVDYGWGVVAPGFRVKLGDFLSLSAEYRTQSDEFLFGYFNQTYELERARVVNGVVRTKQDSLKDIKDPMNGFLAGLSANFLNYLRASVQYQDMQGGGNVRKSLTGDLLLNDNAILALPSVKGYYAQNNVEKLTEWRTPSTIAGFIVKMNVGGTVLAVDNRYTFVDQNGNGVIDGSKETVKSINISTTVSF